ncbi:uncharacterized protein LOC100907773 [Galendromus occidentalis]|uniref:Uncharacterized protein LOC100907773 n=1 Tax=Galendromus occidentalis TaxID=34638 RepID=A0AAJ7SEX9_9ACAR|nr:uncharacterized protein LOC100907773 [Galendromus occidentalis]
MPLDLRGAVIQTCKYSMGLSILGLILIVARLMEVSREIEFLKVVEIDWLGQFEDLTQGNRSILRTDVFIFIGELTASRTILILSAIFVLVYILSWWWMVFALKQAKDDGSVPLRTVLLLSIFAAVDIAASAGFILLRIIMFLIRDKQYPSDLRIPSPADFEHYPAIAAFRLATLKSSTATTDIVVSVIVGFLTGLRVYSVANIIHFYKRSKKGDMYGEYNSEMYSERMEELKPDTLEKAYSTLPKPGSAYPLSSPASFIGSPINRAPSVHSAAVRARPMSLNGVVGGLGALERRSWAQAQNTATSIIDEPLRNDGELQIQAADMPLEMQKTAVQSALQAIRLYGSEKHVAEAIKQDFDQLYSPTWHCIVGRNWGSCVTHSKKCYVRMNWKDMTILLYRSI